MANTKRPEYRSWQAMKARCLNPNRENYKYYGARGITVCDDWVKSFNRFLTDLGEKPSPNHTLDRIDNNGNYEPSNCRWATKSEQQKNTRKFRGGVRASAATNGISYHTVWQRVNKLGWSYEKAISVPTNIKHRRKT